MKKIKKGVDVTEKLKDAVDTLNKAEVEQQKRCATEMTALLNRYGYQLQIQPATIILIPKPKNGGS